MTTQDSQSELRNEITVLKANNLFYGLSIEEVNKYPKDKLRRAEAETDEIMLLIEAYVATRVKEAERLARIDGIIEALEGVTQYHYGYKGEKVIDTYLSSKEKLRPEGEDPAFSLPVTEAIDFYKAKRIEALTTTTNGKVE